MYGLEKSINFVDPFEKTSVREGLVININSWSDSSSYSTANHVVGKRMLEQFDLTKKFELFFR